MTLIRLSLVSIGQPTRPIVLAATNQPRPVRHPDYTVVSKGRYEQRTFYPIGCIAGYNVLSSLGLDTAEQHQCGPKVGRARYCVTVIYNYELVQLLIRQRRLCRQIRQSPSAIA